MEHSKVGGGEKRWKSTFKNMNIKKYEYNLTLKKRMLVSGKFVGLDGQ